MILQNKRPQKGRKAEVIFSVLTREPCRVFHLASRAVLVSLLTSPVVLAGISPEVHEKCLKASDYSGCVEIQTNGVKTTENSEEKCDASGMCIAKKGEDRLGLPKVAGWKYEVTPSGQVNYYEIYNPEQLVDGRFRSVFYFIPHKGQRRYIARKMVSHWYESGVAPTAGQTFSSGGGSTTCNSYGTSIHCNTSRPISTYIPGSPGRVGGPRSVSLVGVVDCKEKTGGLYENGTKLRGDWRPIPSRDLPQACNEIDTLPVLEMEL